MHVNVITLFPELFGPFLTTSFVGRAIDSERLTMHLESLRPYGLGKHLSVDDTPYGGGSGMVMRVDCLVNAMEAVDHRFGASHRVLLTPQGASLGQAMAQDLSVRPRVTLVCGRYEGFDERVRHFVDREISLGDFILTGGEVAAMAVVEACVRLLPGVLGNEHSVVSESFSASQQGLLEYPQYTRPAEFRGLDVPAILKSGDHAKIDAWRREQSISRTLERRPDLLSVPEGTES